MPLSERLVELEDAVCDERTFLDFLNALAQERLADEEAESKTPSNPYGPSHAGWECSTIGTYLDAASAWAESSIDGLPLMPKETNSWKRIAQILHAAKAFE